MTDTKKKGMGSIKITPKIKQEFEDRLEERRSKLSKDIRDFEYHPRGLEPVTKR